MENGRIAQLIADKVKNKDLPCAVAFDIAAQTGMSPAEVGNYADENKLHLVKCQLGLFGYQPEKKIVKPADTVAADLEAAVRNALVNDRLPCKSAWMIAQQFNIRKLVVSSACEALDIKIKPCQLGAF